MDGGGLGIGTDGLGVRGGMFLLIDVAELTAVISDIGLFDLSR